MAPGRRRRRWPRVQGERGRPSNDVVVVVRAGHALHADRVSPVVVVIRSSGRGLLALLVVLFARSRRPERAEPPDARVRGEHADGRGVDVARLQRLEVRRAEVQQHPAAADRR